MGKLTDDMTRLADEIGTMDESRCNFIKRIQNVVKKGADETRQLITDFRSDMDGAHEAFFGNGKKTFSKKNKK